MQTPIHITRICSILAAAIRDLPLILHIEVLVYMEEGKLEKNP